MRLAFGVSFGFCVSAVFGWGPAVGSEPSPMEAFAKRSGVRTVWSSEIARWKQDSDALVIAALVLQDDASSVKMRGVKLALTSAATNDEIYLDEIAMERTRSALGEIADSIARSGIPRTNGCVGAKEFWPLYDWPWNR